MRDKGRTGRWDRQSESKVRDACDQGVMRFVTCHMSQWSGQTSDRVHCTVSSLSPRWLQMAALQTLQCPPAWLQTPPVVWVTAACRHRGPMGTQVWREAGQWGTGRCKGWHHIPQCSVHPVLQIQTAERQPAAVCSLAQHCCRVLSAETEGQ